VHRDHDAADAAVAHQQVAAEPDPGHGTSAGKRAQESREVLDVLRREPDVRGPPTCQDVWRDIGSFAPGVPEFRRDGELAHRPGPRARHAEPARQLVRDGADAARAHRQHHVAVRDHAGKRRREFAHVLDEHGLEPPAAAHGAADRAAVGIRDRLLAAA
jgi:hypothetical protein